MKLITYFLLLFLFTQNTLAHSEHHKNEHEKKETTELSAATLHEINASYQKKVKPLFQQKCFDCHSNKTDYPWYYKLPLAKQLIDHDIEEAREHLDMSNDFPFQGHGSPKEDLEELQEVIEDNEMPLLRYKFLHWDSGLTKAEQESILEWIRTSQSLLEAEQ